MSWTITPQTKVPVDPQFGSVSLLLHGNSSPVTDSSISIKTILNNATTVSAAEKKFGASSLLFNGTSSYLTAPVSDDLSFGSGDFTIEAWIYASSASITTIGVIVDARASDNLEHYVLFANAGGKLAFISTTNFSISSSGSLPTQQWVHVAVTRSGQAVRLFINGAVDGSGTNAASIKQGAILGIGAGRVSGTSNPNGYYFKGYIDDLRITKGVARYTANFTPPTAPFPDI